MVVGSTALSRQEVVDFCVAVSFPLPHNPTKVQEYHQGRNPIILSQQQFEPLKNL